MAKATEEKLVRLERVRADSTVVEANVAYATDSGLLSKAVIALVGLVMVLKAAGLARRTRFRDRRPVGSPPGVRGGGMASPLHRRR